MADSAESRKTPGQDELVKALDTITRAIMGDELSAIKDSLKSMENSVRQQMESVKSTTTASIEALKKETAASIQNLEKSVSARTAELMQVLDKVKKAHADALTDLDGRFSKSLSDMGKQVQKAGDGARASASAIKQELKKELESQQGQMTKGFDSIDERFGNYENELTARKAETKRMSAVLSNVANVFSGAGASAGEHEAAASPKPSAAPPRPAPSPSAAPRPAASPAPVVSRPTPAPAAKEKPADSKSGSDGELPNSDDVEDTMDNIFKLGK